MRETVTAKLLRSHLLEGEVRPGREIGLRIDQTLTQDATGTLVMLEIEAMGIDRVETELSAQYVDHNLIQEDHKNPDDHLLLLSAARRYGLWYSRPGNGVSHPIHQERFGIPGKTMAGSDSHTPSAGAIGMLAIGAGGLEVAAAMAGYPLYLESPRVWGVRLVGELPYWVSAKDVILELLRRHSVAVAKGYVLEYFGPGLDGLSVMDRHVIANMGTELGATSTVFPSDMEVHGFLRSQGREQDWVEILADDDANYDRLEEIDLSQLVPLIAMPSSPDNVVPVEEVAGQKIHQAYVGSSANPGYRDLAVVAQIVQDKTIASHVSLDINPASRQVLSNLIRDGHLAHLIDAGARIHQAGCNGCIGMGQAPASGTYSLRTVPRNFPGRSGTSGDKVCLTSPETAAASALKGVITDPRSLDMEYPLVEEPEHLTLNATVLLQPPDVEATRSVEIVKGPNIASLPEFAPLAGSLDVEVLLRMEDNVSTDEIMPAGARILPLRSNVPAISEYVFQRVDPSFAARAKGVRESGGCAVVAGRNYGQGSSREHAALAPRYLGLRLVLAKGYARIHEQNLVNFGILPLTFERDADHALLTQGTRIRIHNVREQLRAGSGIDCEWSGGERPIRAIHSLSDRQVDILLFGGLINWVRAGAQLDHVEEGKETLMAASR